MLQSVVAAALSHGVMNDAAIAGDIIGEEVASFTISRIIAEYTCFRVSMYS